MDKEKMDKNQIKKVNYSWHVPYDVVLSEVYEKFLNGMKDKKLFGNVCSKCKGLHVPAKPFCDICFEECTDWVETDGIGTLVSFTVLYIPLPTLPNPPSITGIIKVGDSITNLMHHVDNVPFEKPTDLEKNLKIGMKLKPVWKEERIGDMFDIAYFEPA